MLEALSVGTPDVVTDIVNFEDIIDETNGIIVKRGSVSELRKGITISLNMSKTDDPKKIINFDYNKPFS